MRSAITGLLASPFFLYRGEQVPAGLRPGATYAISDLELASKLSFFLWNSIPDDQLLQLAIDGKLKHAAVLERQVRRMLADPRSITLASNFVPAVARHEAARRDRAGLGRVPVRVRPFRSAPRFPHRADAVCRQHLPRRSQRRRSAAGDAHVSSTSAWRCTTASPDVKGDRFRRVELTQSARWGLLGKGAVLMAAAYPNRTSPVLRGAFVLKHIQGVPPANPPMNVPTLDEKDIGTTRALTVREMIAKHRASPTCAACHAVMDPLGLALENFDATGMWRDRDRYAGAPIDSSGVLPDGTPIKGPDDLRAGAAASSRAVRADVHRRLADVRDRA